MTDETKDYVPQVDIPNEETTPTPKAKGHSVMEVFKEVHRQSSMNFFVQVMTKRSPDVTLYELRQNQTEYLFQLMKENEIAASLAANILDMELEEVEDKFNEWLKIPKVSDNG